MIVWLPRFSDDVVQAAWLLTKLTGDAHSGIWLPLSVNVTVPVEPPPPLALTVAVNVTDWLNCDGFREEVTAVVVGTWPPLPLTSTVFELPA